MLYFTGLRISELRYLRERDIDVEQRQIMVIGKGQKQRTVLFPQRVAVLLRQRLSGDSDAFLFPSRVRVGVTPREEWINLFLDRVARAAGLPYHVTAHVLRHGFIRLCKTRGVPLEIAAKLAGHANIQLTAMLYGQLDVSDLQKSYDTLIGG